MILYHGSNLDIASINLNMCRPYKDFGRGFYLTSMEDQARKMAHRVLQNLWRSGDCQCVRDRR